MNDQNDNTQASGQLLTPAEAAEKLRVSTRRMSRWRIEGGGPLFCRLGHRTVAYPSAAIDAFISVNTFRSTSEVAA